jgi:hypothetical protein
MSHSTIKEKLLDAVLHRAASDHDFRTALLANAGGTLHTAYGVTLPQGFAVRFIEKPADVDLLVVLPDAAGDDELSEDDLEQVAGGTAGVTKWSDPDPNDPPPPSGSP